MKKFARVLGLVAGIISIILWIILHFYNPYVDTTEGMLSLRQSIMTLLLPAILAIAASLSANYIFLFIAFLWSLPMSLYVAFTPGIFALFAVTCVAYFISYILITVAHKKA